MAVGIVPLTIMLITIGLKWFAVSALESKRAKLVEAMEETSQVKYRLKSLVSEVTNAQSEIESLKRKIKAQESRVGKLEKKHKSLQAEEAKYAEMNREKLKLAEEVKKKKGTA